MRMARSSSDGLLQHWNHEGVGLHVEHSHDERIMWPAAVVLQVLSSGDWEE